MHVNWNRYILLLCPIILRKAKILLALAWALTTYSRNHYDEEYTFVLSLINELKYTSQTRLFLFLLNQKFDPQQQRIYIIDGTEGNVSFIYTNEQDQNNITLAGYQDNIFLAIPDNETFLGEDFIVCVPGELDIIKIEAFIKKYTFSGIAFKIQVI